MATHGCCEGFFLSLRQPGDCLTVLRSRLLPPSGKSVKHHRVYLSLYKRASHQRIAEMFTQGNRTKTWIVFSSFSLPVVKQGQRPSCAHL